MSETPTDTAGERVSLALLAAAVVLLLAARLPWIGHLLMWDEAMNLCTVRAFVEGADNAYSRWFWMHPPAYLLLISLAAPLADGFAERAQFVTVFLGVAAMLVLYALNRRALGHRLAAWSCLLLAVMPGAAFFDTWIKHDALVHLAGLLALLALAHGRTLWSGVFLGAAFLSKETALFYAVCAALIVLFDGSRRRLRDLLSLGGIAAAMSAWWYLLFSVSLSHITALATGLNVADVEDWGLPWYYYFRKFVLDLGQPGVVLCAAGLSAWIAASRSKREPAAWWWAALLVPALAILSLAHERKPWFHVAVFPALATLQAVGMVAVLRFAARISPHFAAIAGAIILALAAIPRIGSDYETTMAKQLPGMHWGARASRQAARALNENVKEGQRVLVTPAHYWHGETDAPDPIFAYYLKPVPAEVRPHTLTADELIQVVREQRIDWALLSPPPGDAVDRLMMDIGQRFLIRPLIMEGALLYETSAIRAHDGSMDATGAAIRSEEGGN